MLPSWRGEASPTIAASAVRAPRRSKSARCRCAWLPARPVEAANARSCADCACSRRRAARFRWPDSNRRSFRFACEPFCLLSWRHRERNANGLQGMPAVQSLLWLVYCPICRRVDLTAQRATRRRPGDSQVSGCGRCVSINLLCQQVRPRQSTSPFDRFASRKDRCCRGSGARPVHRDLPRTARRPCQRSALVGLLKSRLLSSGRGQSALSATSRAISASSAHCRPAR